MKPPFDEFHNGKTRNAGVDPAYDPPEEFAHGQGVRVARFAAQDDGQPVEVYETRWPASFWAVEALGEAGQGFSLRLGSGFENGQLAFAVARAIAAGMLGLERGEGRVSGGE